MANTLTNLAADIYLAADYVGREMVGYIPSCTVNTGSERAAAGDTVRSHFTRAQTVNETDSPAMAIPEGTDQTVDTKTLSLNKYASVQIPWTGEDVKHVNNGSGFQTVYGDQIKQAMRTIANKIEYNLFVTAYQNASRAVGTAGTTPFGSNHNLVASARQILMDNGCPVEDGQVSLVMSTSAGTNLRNLAQLQKANEAGGTELLRQGTLLDLQGMMIKESGQVASHTAGGATGGLIDNASGEVVGQTTLTLDTVTVNTTGYKAGDIITYTADAVNKYVVNTGLVATAGDIVIGSPGLLIAAPNNNAVTVGASYTPNVAFHRSAIELAIRPPAMPEGGDAADDIMLVQDAWSGLVFEIASYAGYRKRMIEVRCVYGTKAWKPDHIATILG
jgi:hypothetical protein